MKHIVCFLCFVVFAMMGCQPKEQTHVQSSGPALANAVDNPCVQCTDKIRHDQLVCLEQAGTNKVKIQSCNNNAGALWLRECKSLCVLPQGIDTSGPAIKIPTAQQYPCITCTDKLQKELTMCLLMAGDNAGRRELCTQKADDKWFTLCASLCGDKKKE